MTRLLVRKGSLLILCALIIVSLIACNPLGDSVDCYSETFHGYTVPLPSSVTDVTESCSNGINPTYRARFTLPAADLSTLQQTGPISTITDWQTSVPDGASLSDEAAQATSLLYGTSGNGALMLDVLIDTSDAQQYKVYVLSTNVD